MGVKVLDWILKKTMQMQMRQVMLFESVEMLFSSAIKATEL